MILVVLRVNQVLWIRIRPVPIGNADPDPLRFCKEICTYVIKDELVNF
jgi:hypothetical protein